MISDAQSPDGSDILRDAIGKTRGAFISVTIFSFFLNLLMLATPLYMLQVFERVLSSAHVQTLLYLTLITIFALLILGILNTVRTWILSRVSGWLSAALSAPVIEASLETLFKFDAESVEDVYGGVVGVSAGIRELNKQIASARSERDLEITRYVISILTLEKKLSANREMLDQIARTLQGIKSGLDYFSLMHENTILKLGQLYKDTVSNLSPRIIVSGEQMHLGNENNASRIRALLLAGLRSAILWRQCGGSRLSVLFNRKRYENESTLLLREL